jgi:transcriptional regulator with XRE-family HTH domain
MRKSIHTAQYKVFVKVLRDARLRAGLTQVQLAKLLGKEQTFVSKVERGERRLDVVELKAFCEAFGVPLRQVVAAFEAALRVAK